MPVEGLRYYSLLYVCVFLGGYKLLDWQIRRGGGDEEDASDFVVYGVVAVLLGARLGHVFFYEWDRFIARLPEDPLWVFKFWQGGLASHGGTIGLIVAMWLFTWRRKQSFFEGSDRFAFSGALGTILIRIGNFFNSEIVGRKTDQTWGVRFPHYDTAEVPAPLRHPSQLYEAIMGMIVLGVLFWADKALGKEKRPRGALISIFFALYFTGRFFVEYVKEYQVDSLKDNVLTMGQILSIIPALIGYVGLAISLKRKIPAGWNKPELPSAGDSEDDLDKYADDGDGDPDVDDVLLNQDDKKA
jgi:prolipoprotein diacylglyceryl transferase